MLCVHNIFIYICVIIVCVHNIFADKHSIILKTLKL